MADCPVCDKRTVLTLRLREALFRRTGNPLYAWSAFRIARAAEAEVPEWVLDYLETSSGYLLQYERDLVTGEPYEPLFPFEEPDPNRWVAKALGFAASGQGRAPAHEQFSRLERDLAIGFAVMDEKAADPRLGDWKAAQVVGAQFGVSADTVRRCVAFVGSLNEGLDSILTPAEKALFRAGD